MFAKSDADTQVIEDLVFKEPLEQSVQASTILVVGQAKGLASKEKVQALVGKPIGPAPAGKEPLKVKLETTKNKQVVVAVTNQTKVPLHHCLLLARAIPNPAMVERKINSDKTLLLLGGGALGASDKFAEKALDYILLQSVLYNMERGGMVFVPEIPAGGTVRLGLTSADDMVYLKDSELSLWCDELTVTGLKTGTKAGFPPALAGVPFPLKDKNFASVKAELTKSDPRDPKATPGSANVCKVYTLAMTTNHSYLIEATADRAAMGLNNPPALRVEDEAGEVQTTKREPSQTGSMRITFTPPVDGTFRIVCSEPLFGGPGKFTLTVYKKAGQKASKDEAKDPLTFTVDNVDYVYQGTTRNGAQMFVTLLAKSKAGEKRIPLGRMVLVDEEGNQYHGMPIGGFSAPEVLRQGVPLKLVWRFGPNPNNAFEVNPRPAPSAKIKRFASVTVEAGPGGGTAVEFLDVPAVVTKAQGK